MSPFIIILLVLILSVRSSLAIDAKEYRTKRNVKFHEKHHRNVETLDDINYIGPNDDKSNKHLLTVKMEKLRKNLQNRMNTMVKRIIQDDRFAREEKFKLDEPTSENEIPIDEFPIENHLESGRKKKRDEKDSNTVIEETSREIRRGISKNIFQTATNLMDTNRKKLASHVRKVRSENSRIVKRINRDNENETLTKKRGKRADNNGLWIKRDFQKNIDSFNMNALIVRDEEIPPCCTPAKEITNQRYFMCSGAVLTLKHAITTASCMHFADIYKHNIEAELGILVGATNPRSYVIKINRYEMHPDYSYDVDSKNHATHNMAIIFLDCSIVPQDVSVPSLPKGINDDVAHMCCGEGCEIFTIVQMHNNRHIARFIKAKHLPTPKHYDQAPAYREYGKKPAEARRLINKQTAPNETFMLPRRIRSPLKLAEAPVFFRKDSEVTASNRSSKKNASKKRRKPKASETTREKNQQRASGNENDLFNLDSLINAVKSQKNRLPVLRALPDDDVNVQEQLAAVDWSQIEETMSKKFTKKNRKAMETFAKNVVDETIKRLDTVLSDDDSRGSSLTGSDDEELVRLSENSAIFSKLMPDKKKNRTITNFVKVFTKVVASLIPPNSTNVAAPADPLLEESDVEDPFPIYEDCPPLGSPIINNGTLVGLVAYTCDDVQNWVQWRYTDTVKNIAWIRRKISEHYEPEGKCSETETTTAPPRVHSLRELRDDVTFDKNPWMENQSQFRDENIDWTRDETASENTDDFPRNRDDVEIPMTEMSLRTLKDPWFVRNFRSSSREHFAPSKIPVSPNVPVLNVNTCYVKPDGTSECETRTQFNRR